jgi:hypothetical protein
MSYPDDRVDIDPYATNGAENPRPSVSVVMPTLDEAPNCYGYNALWRRRAAVIDIDVDGFEIETLLTLRAARARLKVVEVPSWEARRTHGGSNLNAVGDGWRILKLIVRERTLRRPASSLPNELRHSVRRSVAETSNPRSPDRGP